MLRSLALLTALLTLATAAAAQDLPRRAALGVRLGAPEEGTGGLPVEEVSPGTAAALGLAAGDVLLAVNGHPAAELPEVLKTLRAGDAIEIRYRRGGAEATAKGTAQERPRESVDGYETRYGDVRVPDGPRLRTILTVPPGPGPFPAMLLVQGLGPAGMDFGARMDHPYRRIVDALTRAGFVTLRVEKPGVGDSEGGPHEDVGFALETAGFAAGLEWLAEQPFVDRKNLFLFGHSMGGVMAPLLAADVPYRAAVLYGTSGLTWAEYELENDRRQLALGGRDPAAIDEAMRRKAALFGDLYGSDLSLEEVLRRHPEAADGFPGGLQYGVKRPGFFREIARTNLAAAWAAFPGEVLLLKGESDFVVGERDQEALVEAVNRAHPGRAEYRRVPEMDHGFSRAASPEESFRNLREGRRVPVNEAIVEIVRSFLVERLAR